MIKIYTNMNIFINLLESIAVIVLFIFIIAFCCSSDSKSSSSTPAKRKTRPVQQRPVYHDDDSYCECPSCGAPYYDGYCEECGYPDINQGWIGENY